MIATSKGRPLSRVTPATTKNQRGPLSDAFSDFDSFLRAVENAPLLSKARGGCPSGERFVRAASFDEAIGIITDMALDPWPRLEFNKVIVAEHRRGKKLLYKGGIWHKVLVFLREDERTRCYWKMNRRLSTILDRQVRLWDNPDKLAFLAGEHISSLLDTAGLLVLVSAFDTADEMFVAAVQTTLDGYLPVDVVKREGKDRLLVY